MRKLPSSGGGWAPAAQRLIPGDGQSCLNEYFWLMPAYVVSGSNGGLGRAIRAKIEAHGHSVIGVDVMAAEVIADLSTGPGRNEAVAGVMGVLSSADPEVGLAGVVACAGLGGTVKDTALVAGVNYFGAVGLLDGLFARLASEAQKSKDSPDESVGAVAICSNSASFFTSTHQELVELMLKGHEGSALEAAAGLDGQTVYGLSKLALARAVRRRAVDWGQAGVRINGVAPGPVPTPLLEASLDDPVAGPAIRQFPIPLGRWGRPEDIAEAVWFLLSPQSAWTTGAVLFVDGGTDALIRPESI